MKQKAILLVFLHLLLHKFVAGQESILQDSFAIQVRAGDLKEALQQISDKTGIRFAYRFSTIRNIKVSDEFYSSKLHKILDNLINKNQLCYVWQGNQIILHATCSPGYYTISGYVLEDSTLKPLPYVSVSVAGKSIGVISDGNGYFEIDIPDKSQDSDTVVFSSLGYHRSIVIISSTEDRQLTQLMLPKIYPVNSVLVRPKKYVTIRRGNTKDRPSGSLYIDTHGQQTALFIENASKLPGVIESVEYYLYKKGNTDAPFRVRIYSADSTGQPGNDLIEDAIVVKPTTSGGWYTINVSMLSIKMPESGLFISIEGVFPDDYENYFDNSDFIDLANQNNDGKKNMLDYGQRIGYNRRCRKNTWHYSMNRVWFQLEKQSFGVMVAANVKYEKDSGTEKKSRNE